MYIYRCCSDEEILNYKNNQKYIVPYKNSGTNTFEYDNQEYIHFFLFSESADLFQRGKNNRSVKNIIRCNINYDELKRYKGYGFYEIVIPGFYTPVPEFRIPIKEFRISTIKDISEIIKDEWKRNKAYELYKASIPREYLADYETGAFYKGYDEKSILQFDLDTFIERNIITYDKDIDNDFER